MRAGVFEQLGSTYEWTLGGLPYVLNESGDLVATADAVEAGPGSQLPDNDILERGFNAWFGAPGYYVDFPSVDRVIADQYLSMPQPYVGANPWDWLYGTNGTPALVPPTAARQYPDQSGFRSLS